MYRKMNSVRAVGAGIRGLVLWSLLTALLTAPLGAQSFAVGVIDVYGAQRVGAPAVRTALGLAIGDTLVMDSAKTLVRRAEQRLMQLPGVSRAKVNLTCCEAGRLIIYIGVAEAGSDTLVFRGAPTGAVRLPPPIVDAGDAFYAALMDATRRGDTGESDSLGYTLANDTTMQRIQRSFVSIAAAQLPLLREVLRGSSVASQRALAAQIIGYASDRQAAAADLAFAMTDPDANVRNAAMRALWIIASYGQAHPNIGLRVSAEPFVRLLSSIEWTDRNKSSLALVALTASRDPQLLASIRAGALTALLDMARWTSPGHAYAGLVLLSRIAGIPEEELQAAIRRGDRQRVLGP